MISNASAAPLYRQVRQAAYIGLAINLSLGIIKLIGGLLGNSFALLTDAVNSLGDSLTTVAVLYALRVAQRPGDSEHPYGHTRAEGIVASNVAVVIFCAAVLMGVEAINHLFDKHDVPATWTLLIAGSNVIIKEVLYRYCVIVGRRTGSSAIIANAWDHRADALCSLAVLIGLSVVRWGGDPFLWADEVAALVVVAAIMASAIELFRRSASELMDQQAEPELVDQIRAATLKIPGVRGVEKLWVRKSGLEYLADLHLQVDAAATVAVGHELGHRVKDQLLADFPQLRHVLIHLEPFPHEHHFRH